MYSDMIDERIFDGDNGGFVDAGNHSVPWDTGMHVESARECGAAIDKVMFQDEDMCHLLCYVGSVLAVLFSPSGS